MKGNSTALVGGLSQASSLQVAKDWLCETMKKAQIEGVTDVFSNGDFKGLLFVKFSSVELRDAAMGKFNSLQTTFSDKKNFMNADLPIQTRVPQAFLRSLKKLLVEWGFNSSSVQWNEDDHMLKVGGSEILKVGVNSEFAFEIKWLSPKWEAWEPFTQDEQFKAIFKFAESKIQDAAKRFDKGKGKGCKGPSA